MDIQNHIHIIGRVIGKGEHALVRTLFGDSEHTPSQVRLPSGAPPNDSIVTLRLTERQAEAGPEHWHLLAPAGSAQAALYGLIKRHRISPYYPRAVRDEVAAILQEPGIDDPSLLDLQDLPFVTIDNDDSRDLDQALHIERAGAGYTVRYALADASYYVRPGSALFAEALERGVSYYLPGFSVPMLPAELSEGLISLNPQVPRRALVFVMHLDADGLSQHTELIRARIKSRAQLSYNGVQAYYDDPASSPLAGQDYSDSLTLLAEVGRKRIAISDERDAVQFDRDEAEALLSPDCMRFEVVREHRNACSLYNEQISLLCNMEGARFMASDPHEVDLQAIYRIHAAPEGDSLRALADMIAHLVALRGLNTNWLWRRRDRPGAPGESLATYLDRLPRDPATEPLRQAIERQVLLVNRRSCYSPEPGRHFALGVIPYSRFSSPMREIVGVFTHKEALEKLGLEPPRRQNDDRELRDQVIKAANRSKDRQNQLEAEAMKLAVDQLLRADLQTPREQRPLHHGSLLGVKATRMYVRLDDPPVELKIYIDALSESLGRPLAANDDHTAIYSGDQEIFKVGDRVALRCQWYDEQRGKWHLVPVEPAP